jgi:hypothetical protein
MIIQVDSGKKDIVRITTVSFFYGEIYNGSRIREEIIQLQSLARM